MVTRRTTGVNHLQCDIQTS